MASEDTLFENPSTKQRQLLQLNPILPHQREIGSNAVRGANPVITDGIEGKDPELHVVGKPGEYVLHVGSFRDTRSILPIKLW
jgi:hypothetical protein